MIYIYSSPNIGFKWECFSLIRNNYVRSADYYTPIKAFLLKWILKYQLGGKWSRSGKFILCCNENICNENIWNNVVTVADLQSNSIMVGATLNLKKYIIPPSLSIFKAFTILWNIFISGWSWNIFPDWEPP